MLSGTGGRSMRVLWQSYDASSVGAMRQDAFLCPERIAADANSKVTPPFLVVYFFTKERPRSE